MGSQFSTGTIRNLIQENFDFDLRSIQNAHKCHQQTAVRSGLRLIESTFIDVRQFQNLFGFSRIKSRDIFLIFDPSQKGKIFSNDIFGGLCLASNSGDDKEKLDFLFKLTDYQTAGELNREELIMGMHSSCRGLARIKSLNHPSIQQLEMILNDFCHENENIDLDHITHSDVTFLCKHVRVRSFLSNLDSASLASVCSLYKKQAELLRELVFIDEKLDEIEGFSLR